MTEWALKKTEQENDRYTDGLIKLSRMVGDGRLSNAAAKEVYAEFTRGHNWNLYLIEALEDFDLSAEVIVLPQPLELA